MLRVNKVAATAATATTTMVMRVNVRSYAKAASPKHTGTRKQKVAIARSTNKVHFTIKKNQKEQQQLSNNGDVLSSMSAQPSYRHQHYGMNNTDTKILHQMAHELQMKKLRQQYKIEYFEKKAKSDAQSVKRFNLFRQKVLQYRQLKREITLRNIYRHQEVTDILDEERERFFREKYQRRLNMEASRHAQMQSAIAQLSSESQYFITPENLERHIERELNPARVLINHSLFGPDKVGVNDEVALHAMRVHQHQHQLRLEEEKISEKMETKKQLFRIGNLGRGESDASSAATTAVNLTEQYGTSANPVPSSFSTVNSLLFDNKFIRDILYPYSNVLRDDVMMRKEMFEAEADLHDSEEDFDEAELTTIDLHDPEDMEMLKELSQEEGIDLDELIQDVQDMQYDEEMSASASASTSQKKGKKGAAASEAYDSSSRASSSEEAQKLAADLKRHQEMERIRRNPSARMDKEYLDNVLNSYDFPKEGKRAGFYDAWLESYPSLAKVIADATTQSLSGTGHSSETTLSMIAQAMSQDGKVQAEFNQFLSQFMPNQEEFDESATVPVAESKEDIKNREIEEENAKAIRSAEDAHNLLRSKFGDDLFSGPTGLPLKEKLMKVKTHLLAEGFSSETATLWTTVIESKILSKQMKKKK